MKIVKYSGEKVDFSVEVFKSSLEKSGADEDSVEKVYEKIKPLIFDGISSKELYELAYQALKEIAQPYAARYSLKKAIQALGPTGFYFEQWLAEVLKSFDNEVMINLTLQGNSVSHEIDIVAKNKQGTYLIECKFRNQDNSKIDVKTPMYILSRFKDLENKKFSINNKNIVLTKVCLATNGVLTKDAISFGEHYGMQLLSWNYPEGKSIKNLVDEKYLYPVTCLTSVTDEDKNSLLESKFILVKDLLNNAKPKTIKSLAWKKAQQEAKEIIV